MLEEHFSSERHQKNAARLAHQHRQRNFSQVDPTNEPSALIEASRKLTTIGKTMKNNHEQLGELEEGLFSTDNDDNTLTEQLGHIEGKLRGEKCDLEVIQASADVLHHEAVSTRERFENHNQIIKQYPDGTFVWKITQVQEKIYDAQSERQTSIYSPIFFTSPSGYCACIRLYLNGDGSARGTHLSIFLVIFRGPYDGILQWPFHKRVSFCLYDQRTIMESNGTIQPKHVIESFRPDLNSQSFSQPCTRLNIASGIPKFCSLDVLANLNNANLYVVDDTMYIKAFIDFIDVPRSMLQFIFNINLALPGHIQYKLINDELKRYQEQNPRNQD